MRNERFNNKVVYSTFIDKLKNYILSNFNDAKDLIPIIEEFKDPESDIIAEQPVALKPGDKKNQVMLWIKQEQVKTHIKRLVNLKNNKETLYGIMWGQLSSGLQEAIKAESDYEVKLKVFDSAWLLEKSKLISSGVDEKANKYLSLLKAITTMVNIRQGQNESNDSFRKRIDSVAMTVTLIGGDKMLYSGEIANVNDPDKPTKDELKTEVQRIKAMLMIIRSDYIRYGDLQESLLEGMHKGRDEFPKTVVDAYDLLQRISNNIYQSPAANQTKQKRFLFRRNKQSTNLSFTQKGKTCELVPGRDGKVHDDIECHNCHQMGHYTNQCPHKKKIALAQFTLTQNKLELINRNWVLLDTCSTVSVFCNSELE